MKKNKKAKLLGRYIVADSEICHGKPTFRGTRIFVSDVLEMVAEGMAWETIIEQWRGSITKEAIAEAVKLSSEAFLKHADEFALWDTLFKKTQPQLVAAARRIKQEIAEGRAKPMDYDQL